MNKKVMEMSRGQARAYYGEAWHKIAKAARNNEISEAEKNARFARLIHEYATYLEMREDGRITTPDDVDDDE